MNNFYKYIVLLCLIANVSAETCLATNYGQRKIDSILKELPNIKEDSSKIQLMNIVAFEYYGICPDSGIIIGEKALELATTNKYKLGIANSLKSIGINYWAKADFPNALDNLQKSLSIFEELNDKIGIAKNLNNIGLIYNSIMNYDKALEYYLKGLQNSIETNSKFSEAKLLVNIGSIYDEKGDKTLAIDYFLKARKIFEEIKEGELYTMNLGNIASCYIDLKNYAKAIEYIDEAKKKNEIYNNLVSEYSTCDNLGKLHYFLAVDSSVSKEILKLYPQSKKEKLKIAIQYLSKSALKYKEIGNIDKLIVAYNLLFLASKANGQNKDALDWLEKGTKIRDSIFSSSNEKKINFLESQREINLRDKQIKINELEIKNQKELIYIIAIAFTTILLSFGAVLLMFFNKKKMTVQLEEQNKLITDATVELEILNEELHLNKDELSEANAAKDKFFSIISHDLRSPISAVLGLSEMIYNEIDELDNNELKDMIKNHSKNFQKYLRFTQRAS